MQLTKEQLEKILIESELFYNDDSIGCLQYAYYEGHNPSSHLDEILQAINAVFAVKD
jgi:hypothetical protein